MSRNKRLLLVEDNELYGRSLSRGLRMQGIDVTWLRSHADVHTALEQPDLVAFHYAIVDDLLPDGRGLDLLSRLDQLLPRPATALVTADVADHRALSALYMGRVLLPKPRDIAATLELLTALDSLGSPAVTGEPEGRSSTRATPSFVLRSDSLSTPIGAITLPAPTVSLLDALFRRAGALSSAAELAREIKRADAAGAALIRRRVADARKALGAYAWLIQSVPKRGYRLDPRAFE